MGQHSWIWTCYGISIDGWVLINVVLFVHFYLCFHVKETFPFSSNLDLLMKFIHIAFCHLDSLKECPNQTLP